MEPDRRYYLRRAAEERLAASRSVTAAARDRHAELAARFSAKAEQWQSETRQFTHQAERG